MERKQRWAPTEVRTLRKRLGLSQQALAAQLGVRQQTVSDWETGLYTPRGASITVLNMVAERTGTTYGTDREPSDEHGSGPGTQR